MMNVQEPDPRIQRALKGGSLGLRDVPPELLDGLLVHSAALQCGLDTLLFPGQSLILSTGQSGHPGGGPSHRQSFAHGVPEQTNLSMATMVQNQRVRRALLEARGIAVPRGATFTIGKGVRSAAKFAKKIGYPVVIKPVVGDSIVENQYGIQNSAALMDAIGYYRIAPTHRKAFVTASYAFAAAHTPREEGSVEARPSYRFLVEKQLRGCYVRIVLLYDQVLSAIVAPGGPYADDGEDVTLSIHQSIQDLAIRVLDAVPGLGVTTIDLVLSDGPDVALDGQSYAIVEVSERPWLHLQAAISSDLAGSVAGEILKRSIERRSINVPRQAARDVAVSVRWEGISNMDDFLVYLTKSAKDLEVDFAIHAKDGVGGTARGEISGDALSIAMINEFLVDGRFPGERIMAVELTQ